MNSGRMGRRIRGPSRGRLDNHEREVGAQRRERRSDPSFASLRRSRAPRLVGLPRDHRPAPRNAATGHDHDQVVLDARLRRGRCRPNSASQPADRLHRRVRPGTGRRLHCAAAFECGRVVARRRHEQAHGTTAPPPVPTAVRRHLARSMRARNSCRVPDTSSCMPTRRMYIVSSWVSFQPWLVEAAPW